MNKPSYLPVIPLFLCNVNDKDEPQFFHSVGEAGSSAYPTFEQFHSQIRSALEVHIANEKNPWYLHHDYKYSERLTHTEETLSTIPRVCISTLEIFKTIGSNAAYLPPSTPSSIDLVWNPLDLVAKGEKAVSDAHDTQGKETLSDTDLLHSLIKKIDALGTKLAIVEDESRQMRSELNALKSAASNEDPLAAARMRGAKYKRAELESPDNITLDQAREVFNRSTRMINADRLAGHLYALVADGNSRGYRYPRWQFEVEQQRLRPVLAALNAAKLSSWTMHGFFLRPNIYLSEQSPKDAIADTRFPLSAVVDAVHRQFDVDQGAV